MTGEGGRIPAALPELLAPAGDPEKLRVALHYGADAVYLGLPRFSLRAMARNFDEETLARGVAAAQRAGRRAYVTVNVFPHAADIPFIEEHARFLAGVRPDGVIVSDPGVFSIFRRLAPGLPLHVSTQANITSPAAARFWEDLGARRLVLARELSLEEIRAVCDAVAAEIEVFVHGALCLSYSGRCYLSSFLAHRGANRGLCTNSCRWRYALVEEKRPGEFLPVFEDPRGAYVLSPRDLCLIDHLDALAAAGVDSFKVEGRTKGINYLAAVVRVYRRAIDALAAGASEEERRGWRRELSAFGSRGHTTGMLLGPMGKDDYNFDDRGGGTAGWELVGFVEAAGPDGGWVRLRNRLGLGDRVECLCRSAPAAAFDVVWMRNGEGLPVEAGVAGDRLRMALPPCAEPGDLLRRRTARPASM